MGKRVLAVAVPLIAWVIALATNLGAFGHHGDVEAPVVGPARAEGMFNPTADLDTSRIEDLRVPDLTQDTRHGNVLVISKNH